MRQKRSSNSRDKGTNSVKWLKVKSSNLYAVRYTPQKKQLEVVFNYDKFLIYLYEGVPKITYTRMLQSDSIGRYCHTKIQHRYRFTKFHTNKQVI